MGLQEQEGAPIIDHFMSGLFDDAGRVLRLKKRS